MAENTIKYTIDIDAQPVKSLKLELRETVEQLQRMDAGSAEFEKMTIKAAELKDKIADTNEQIAVFASGSKYEQAANGLGSVGDALRNLDFGKAQERAASFATVAKSISFGDAIKSVKELGGTFMTLGKAILTNPLFLIAAVVAAVVAAIVKLMDELGLLEVVFKAIGDAVGFVIQQLKDMLDWLGLTSYAEEDKASRTASAQEKIAESYAKKRDAVVDSYDHEIRMAKIAGKDTTELERQKQYAIIQTSEAQAEALKAQIISMRAAGTLTAEKAKEIRAAMAELKKGVSEAKQELQAINAQEVADNNAANEKKAADNKAAAKAAADRRKQEAADRLAAARMIEDAELKLMQDGIEKERLENEVRYRRLIEDTKANTKLLAEEKAALVLSLEQQEFEARKAIEQKYLDESNAAVKAATDARIAEEERKTKVLADAAKQLSEANKKQAADEIARRVAVKDATLDLAGQVLSGLAANMKEGSNAAKSVAVAQATMDTYRAATAAFASTAANPITTVFPAAPFIAAASAVAMGIANIRKIVAVQPSTGGASMPSVGGMGSAPNFGAGQAQQQTPQMNLNNGQNQTAQSTNKERVFVVDYMDIQDKGNELQMSQQKVILA